MWRLKNGEGLASDGPQLAVIMVGSSDLTYASFKARFPTILIVTVTVTVTVTIMVTTTLNHSVALHARCCCPCPVAQSHFALLPILPVHCCPLAGKVKGYGRGDIKADHHHDQQLSYQL